MRIIRINDIKDITIFQRLHTVNNITFLQHEQIHLVIDAANDVDTLKMYFDKVGIKYDDLMIAQGIIMYCVDGVWLPISELSGGERYILYLLACKKSELKVIAHGLFECLGDRLTNIALNEFSDYKNLIIVQYNYVLSGNMLKYVVKEIC